MRIRHSAVETDGEGERFRSFLESARAHERAAKVELSRRNIRLEVNRPSQDLDGFGGPAGADELFPLPGEPFGLAGVRRRQSSRVIDGNDG